MQPCTLRGLALDAARASSVDFIVTGASGWIGKCLLEALHGALGPEDFTRRVCAVTSAGRPVPLRGGLVVPTIALGELAGRSSDASVVFHFAYLTREKAMQMPLEAYVQANRGITDQVMACLPRLHCKALVMPSSGAVYRPNVAEPGLSAANAYGKLKLEDEQRALAWAREGTGQRAVVCRVFNIAGPYINKYSDYALASAIEATLLGQPVRIRTAATTLRSFVAVDELLSVFVALALGSEDYQGVFDSAGERVLEIDELIDEVQATLGRRTALERPPRTDALDRYLGDRAPYAELLQRCGITPVPLKEQILTTADYIRDFPTTPAAGAQP